MKHALYQHWQGEYKAAYGVAEYYQLRGFFSPELRLAQASASLELGYLAHGPELTNDLDEGSLLPENQSRLHLYLARDAYRRRDWTLRDEHSGVLKFSGKADYLMASLYQILAEDLMASERPKNLNALEQDQYELLLEEQAYPFEEQPIGVHHFLTRARK